MTLTFFRSAFVRLHSGCCSAVYLEYVAAFAMISAITVSIGTSIGAIYIHLQLLSVHDSNTFVRFVIVSPAAL